MSDRPPADTRIMLVSGELYDLADPSASRLTLNDIAHGLSMVCRFAGQASRFYSVAEHSVHVARLVPPHLGRAALLHDAAEALIGDVSRPLKSLLPDYRQVEARIEFDLAARFTPPGQRLIDWHVPDIKAADLAMCAVEARFLMSPDADYWAGIGADPALVEIARRRCRLNYDRPEFAAIAWLRAWQHCGHIEAELAAGVAPAGDDAGEVAA